MSSTMRLAAGSGGVGRRAAASGAPPAARGCAGAAAAGGAARLSRLLRSCSDEGPIGGSPRAARHSSVRIAVKRTSCGARHSVSTCDRLCACTVVRESGDGGGLERLTHYLQLRPGPCGSSVRGERWSELPSRSTSVPASSKSQIAASYSNPAARPELAVREAPAPPATSRRHRPPPTSPDKNYAPPSRPRARERYHAVQRRHRELVVAQRRVVIRMLRPHADARREV